jgi:hypothetical protein
MGDDDPFGDPRRFMIVDEIVFLAACFALSVLTKLDTRSSRFPLRFGEASSSKGPTSVCSGELCVMCVIEEPLAGDSLADDEGEDDAVDCLGEDDDSDPPGGCNEFCCLYGGYVF